MKACGRIGVFNTAEALIVKAYQGEMYKLPWAGVFAEKQVF